ncbi:hypothetical protein [Shewanella halifaxensis]|nr:hypothetical protein [Shewanella halifaxensis]
MKKLIAASILVSLSSAASADEQETLDMSDPTAVYSSLGISVDTREDLDVNGGFAWGVNQLLIETKGGGDSVSLTYARMTEGSGLYAETTFNKDLRSVNAGYITTFSLAESMKLYPVIMGGYINDEVSDDVTPIMSTGFYFRYNFGSGFHLGVDPFYTIGTDSFDSFVVDTFLGYQYKSHRFRVGIDEDKEVSLEYKIAFF